MGVVEYYDSLIVRAWYDLKVCNYVCEMALLENFGGGPLSIRVLVILGC